MATANSTKHCLPRRLTARRHSQLIRAAGAVALLAATGAGADPGAEKFVMAAAYQPAAHSVAGRSQEITPVVAAGVTDVAIGFDQQPLDDQMLSRYRGTGEQRVGRDASHRQVAVILWDERGRSGQGTTKTGTAGYGNSQGTNVVIFQVK